MVRLKTGPCEAIITNARHAISRLPPKDARVVVQQIRLPLTPRHVAHQKPSCRAISLNGFLPFFSRRTALTPPWFMFFSRFKHTEQLLMWSSFCAPRCCVTLTSNHTAIDGSPKRTPRTPSGSQHHPSTLLSCTSGTSSLFSSF